MPILRVGELFAGAGGLGLGFILAEHERIRYQPIFAIDNDKNSLRSYRRNIQWLLQNAPNLLENPVQTYTRDVEKLTAQPLLRLFQLRRGELDLLIGGPPCQGYSSSNRSSKLNEKETLNRLTKVFLDRVSEFRPKMFLIENVQGVRWTEPTEEMRVEPAQLGLFPGAEMQPGSVRDFLVQRAHSLGYRVWYDILDAVNFGVPQHRHRFFLFGIQSDLISDQVHVSLAPYLQQRMEQPVTVGQAILDLPRMGNGKIWTGEYHPDQDNEYVARMRRFMLNGDLYDHATTNHKAYVIDRFRRIPEGENWQAIQQMMRNYKHVDKTHSNIYRRLRRDLPAHTMSHYRKSMTIHPDQNRGLSFREACRLQSFPDWFRFEGTSEEQQQQLANAVPPLMGAAVAWAIAEFCLDARLPLELD